mmetsp:Transcript_7144/g.14449  ORF Transcript_7144/g.14449 Transcript_7144/m.14449 type:complete len:263 (+) Transcript_7144:625-1413(+)
MPSSPFSSSARSSSKASCCSRRRLSISAWDFASLESSISSAATCPFNCADFAVALSNFVVKRSISSLRSSFLSVVSLSSLSQYAFFVASASASSSSFAIMSWIMFLTLANTSSRAAPRRSSVLMRLASWASSVERSLRAKSRIKRTTEDREAWARAATCSMDTCANEPPEVASSIAFLAAANALSSSPRLAVSASKSCALDMQSWCKLAFASVSAASSFFASANSPSAVDFFSVAAAMPFFASSNSFFAKRIASSSACRCIS